MTQFVVIDVFDIKGRGSIIVPGFHISKDHKIKIGDKVIVKLNDGGIRSEVITGMSLESNDNLHIMISGNIGKDKLIGSTVSLA